MSTCFAFMMISSMEDLGRLVGFEQMGELGVAIIFGSVYMHLTALDVKKKDKEEEKDGVD
jgi:hypothetical protein